MKFYKLRGCRGIRVRLRHQQYEMFYSGATFVTKGHSYRTYDWSGADKLVQGMLDSYSLDDAAVSSTKAA